MAAFSKRGVAASGASDRGKAEYRLIRDDPLAWAGLPLDLSRVVYFATNWD
jgi:hypothetical protein